MAQKMEVDYYSVLCRFLRDGHSWNICDVCCRSLVSAMDGDDLNRILSVMDENGMRVFNATYDAWDYQTVRLNAIGLRRGYTGHEMLNEFEIINMNGRLYDPVIGRFLSPDNYVQMPNNSQSFNRYSYCLNNPLKYNDPSGEFFFSIFTSAANLFKNVFKHGVNISQYNWKETVNAWKIDMGMFKGNFFQVLGKWTTGAINSVIGNTVAHGLNLLGKVDKVTSMDGMLALSGVTGNKNSAFTIGHYSFGPHKYKADWRDHLFVHEYGHYIQSQRWGALYLPVIGISSLASATFSSKMSGVEHKERWFEVNASKLGAKYFDKHYGEGAAGFQKHNENYFDVDKFINGGITPYINPRTGSYWQEKAFPISKPKITFWDFII